MRQEAVIGQDAIIGQEAMMGHAAVMHLGSAGEPA